LHCKGGEAGETKTLENVLQNIKCVIKSILKYVAQTCDKYITKYKWVMKSVTLHNIKMCYKA
jgi:hypothetical protein